MSWVIVKKLFYFATDVTAKEARVFVPSSAGHGRAYPNGAPDDAPLKG